MAALYLMFYTKTPVLKQFFTVPVASGKSRMLAAFILGARNISTKNFDKFVIMFPHKILKEQDQDIYNNLEIFTNETGAKVQQVVGMEEAQKVCDTSTLLLLDEADVELIDHAKKPPPAAAILAMSATDATEGTGYEAHYLKKIGFNVK